MLALLLRPRFWPGHLAMVVCVAIAGGLGLWQLDAWRQHRAEAARDLANAPAVALADVMTGDSPFPGRSLGQPVSFTGSWLADGTVYVSDRELRGRTGYWVVTPVVVAGSDSAMPVVRGWSTRPDAPAPSGDVAVTGWLQATEGSNGVDEDPRDDVIPALRVASLVEHVDRDLYSGYVIARDLAPDTARATLEPLTLRARPDVSLFTAARNFFYAVEWWVFGGFAMFIWVRWCRDSLHPVPRDDEQVGGPGPEDGPDPRPGPDGGRDRVGNGSAASG